MREMDMNNMFDEKISSNASWNSVSDDETDWDYKNKSFDDDRDEVLRNYYNQSLRIRKMIVSVICIILVLAVSLVVFIAYSINRTVALKEGYKTIESDISSHNYTDAAIVRDNLRHKYDSYDVQRRLSEYDKKILSSGIGYAQEIAIAGDYEAALSILKQLSGIVPNEEIDKRTETITIMQMQSVLDQYNQNNNTQKAIEYIETCLSQNSNLDKDTVILSLSSYIDAYKSTLMSEAESYANCGEYDNAISSLKTIGRISEDSDITEKIGQYCTEKISHDIPDGDLPTIITYLERSMDEYGISGGDLITTLNTYTTDYKQEVFEKEREALDRNQYDSAVKLLNEAKALLPDDGELNSEISRVRDLRPISLYELSPYSGNDLEIMTFTDNYQTVHTDGVRRYLGDNEFKSTFSLNQKYKRFCMDLFVDESAKNIDNDTGLFIYCDDVLVYAYDSDRNERNPVSIDIDITGVDDFRIELTRVDYWGRSMKAASAYLFP